MLTIRPQNLTDAPRIAVLTAQVWVHTYATEGVSEAIAQYVLSALSVDQIQQKLNAPDRAVLVAEIDDHLVGYVLLRFNSVHAEVNVEIETLYVLDAYARRGIGTALLERAIACAADRTGKQALWLSVNVQNARAVAFYLAYGMRDEGRSWFHLGDQAHENIVMVWRATDPSRVMGAKLTGS